MHLLIIGDILLFYNTIVCKICPKLGDKRFRPIFAALFMTEHRSNLSEQAQLALHLILKANLHRGLMNDFASIKIYEK